MEKVNPYSCSVREVFPWSIFIEFKSSYFHRYIKFIKSNIDAETKILDKQWEEAKNKEYINDDHREWETDSLINEAFLTSETEQLMLRSFVVSVFIFIEESLNDFCRHIERSHQQTFSVSDMKGMGIDKALRYIEVIFDKNFPFNEKVREDLRVARKIRNALVHNDGKLQKNDVPSVEKHFKENSILVIKQTKDVTLSFEYANSLIELSEQISKELSGICQVEPK